MLALFALSLLLVSCNSIAQDEISSSLAEGIAPSDTTTPTLSVSNVTAKAGKSIEVIVSIQNNPGILGMKFSLSWDEDALTLTNVKNGDALENLTYQPPSNEKSGCNFLWYGAETGKIEDGEILKLTFKVSRSASEKDYGITLVTDSGDNFDSEFNSISFDAKNGKVSVIE